LFEILTETASNCTVCGGFQNGIQGSLNFGAAIGATLTKKVLGTDTPLWSLNFAVSHSAFLAVLFRRLFESKSENPHFLLSVSLSPLPLYLLNHQS
jgi:hypothetical protein